MDHIFHQSTSNHGEHDVGWLIISSSCEYPVCIACLVEQLADQTLTKVHHQYILSLLSSVLECEDVLYILRRHYSVCEQILQIIIENHSIRTHVMMSVKVFVQVMETMESEGLYISLLDKFQLKVCNDNEMNFFILEALNHLASLSSKYVLTLLHSHEPLLMQLLSYSSQQTRISEIVIEADNVDTSMLSLLIHMFEDSFVLTMLSKNILCLVEQCLGLWITSCKAHDAQLKVLVLAKLLLSAESSKWLPAEDMWMGLVHGFKKMFVSKKDDLIKTAAECIDIVAMNECHSAGLNLILCSDITEFLFESLNTMNNAQLEAVLRCLKNLTKHDLFFKKCHAIYGIETILRCIDNALQSGNVFIGATGLSLFSDILTRQSNQMPLFYSGFVLQMALSVLQKAILCSPNTVVISALDAATKLVIGPIGVTEECVHNITMTALSTVGKAMWKDEKACKQTSGAQMISQESSRLLATFFDFLNAAVKSHAAMTKHSIISGIAAELHDIITYIAEKCLSSSDESILKSFLTLMATIFMHSDKTVIEVSKHVLSSSLLFHILQIKNCTSDLEMVTLVSSFLISVFKGLVRFDLPHYDSLPDYLQSGVSKLFLKCSIQQTVESLNDENATAAWCMYAYFSWRSGVEVYTAHDVHIALDDLFNRNMLCIDTKKPLLIRFLLFLLLKIEETMEDFESPLTNLAKMEATLLQQLLALPVELWATPCAELFLWTFKCMRRSDAVGTLLLEYWLFSTKGCIFSDNSDVLSSVISKLFQLSNFRIVLMRLLTSTCEETSSLTKTLCISLTKLHMDCEALGTWLEFHEEIMSAFQYVFLCSIKPSCHIVCNFLQIDSCLLIYHQSDLSSCDCGKVLRVICHVIHFLGEDVSDACEIGKHVLSYIHAISINFSANEDHTVLPILLENVNIFKLLEDNLHADDIAVVDSAIAVLAWIAMASMVRSYQVKRQVRLTSGYLLSIIASRRSKAALTLLSLSIEPTGLNCPLVFSRSDAMMERVSIFTSQEIYLLFCHVQQFVCLGDEDLQMSAVKCLLKLIAYGSKLSKSLEYQLVFHPWNQFLLQHLLSSRTVSGIDEHVAKLASKVLKKSDMMYTETSNLLLKAILATGIPEENKTMYQDLVKKVYALTENNEIRTEAEKWLCLTTEMEALSQTPSANTPVPTVICP